LGALEVWAPFLQKPYAEVDTVLFIGVEAVPPNEKLVGKLDLPSHEVIMD
jgi:hypothetical protein